MKEVSALKATPSPVINQTCKHFNISEKWLPVWNGLIIQIQMQTIFFVIDFALLFTFIYIFIYFFMSVPIFLQVDKKH